MVRIMTRMLTKPTVTAVVVTALLLPLAAFASAAEYRLTVDGLACPFCAYGVEKGLKATEGVKSIQIDINGGVVRVTMAEGAAMTEAQAQQIVEDAGFTLRRFEKVPGTP